MQVAVDGRRFGGRLTELASGVDALYLSGKANLPAAVLDRLDAARRLAEESEAPVPFDLGGVGFALAPHGLGRYRYHLDHAQGKVGISPSTSLPAIRIQPRAELIHGVGPVGTVRFFADLLEAEVGPLQLTVSRIDLFADFQGWDLRGNDRHRFVCRGRTLGTYEADEKFTGFVFGKRSTNTIAARIYDKTTQAQKEGIDYWPEIWGEAFTPALPVHRVEFEIGRSGLRQYGVAGPDEALAVCGAIWANVTEEWLTYRLPTADTTKARWPIAQEWQDVQRASIRQKSIGLDRTTEGKRLGSLRTLMPALVGYLVSGGALTGADTLEETFERLGPEVVQYGRRRQISFEDRIIARRAEIARS